jgi:hypothetical protein
MGVKSRVGPRVQIERSPKNDVLALVLHAAVSRVDITSETPHPLLIAT